MRAVLEPILSGLGDKGHTQAEREGLLLQILSRIQDTLGCIPPDVIPDVAKAMGLPGSRVHAVVTFYPSFTLGAADATRVAEGEAIVIPGSPSADVAPPKLDGQVRRVLARLDAVAADPSPEPSEPAVYAGLEAALAMSPEAVLDVVRASGLRGRGGAGFPVAAKWEAARNTPASARHVVCNAAEGDPGASMDRYILSGDPHIVIEGMAIAAYAAGATQGHVYIRAEYGDVLPAVTAAIGEARELNCLSQRVLGSSFSFDIAVSLAAGRYVCGEETALLNSMEGKRGNPRLRPPYPTKAGLWDSPTVVNNVKTLANVPLILQHGPDWFREVGTEASTGTAVLSLCGDIARPGVIEVPMGTSLRRVIDIGGGVPAGKSLKAVQTGGPLGGVIPESLIDTPMSFEAMAEIGSPLGSGGLIVYSSDRCMVSVARQFAEFAHEETCGHCIPCRLGTAQVAQVLCDITEGRAREADEALLAKVAEAMRYGAFCAFGQAGADVVMSTMRHFADEYHQHIHDRRCPAGVCAMIQGSP